MSELFLLAHVAGQGVAISTTQIESVIDVGPIVPAPRAAPGIRGLIALRSRVVTAVDTAMMLGLDTAGMVPRRAVISLVDGHHYAFLVQALEDVARFDRRPLGTSLAMPAGWAAAASGLVTRDGEPLVILDLAALLPSAALAA